MHSKFESIKNYINTLFILILELKIGTEIKLHSVKSLPLLLIEYKLTLYNRTKRVKAKIKRIRTLLIEQKPFFKDLQDAKYLKPKL